MAVGVRYKILFVGLGSIGQRHLKNIVEILRTRGIDFQIDTLRMQNVGCENITNVYVNKNKLPDDYDVVFVTNPTSFHYETVVFLHNKAKYFFIEKPIFDKIYDISFLKNMCYVACPLRFHPIVKNLKNFAQSNKIISFRAICSSYLPEWRPNIDYRSNYSAQKSMGGGVELDLIHEIDYLMWIFGKPIKVLSLLGKKSNLEINSNDVALYIMEFPDLMGSLHLDYFGRYSGKTKREIEIFTNNDAIIFDIVGNRIHFLSEDKMNYLPAEDVYMNEMNYFLDIITGGRTNYYNDPQNAVESLKIALGES
ncbi:MAG: Gfo/Idh/MocA family oxidoreductase [Holosporaceae bacterium]|jgi:predicted dehydrogenase|nr:Gfo/Idh/MocA family oxidoreductase [Holosporaceae bacterium]